MADFAFDWDTEYPSVIIEAVRQRVNQAVADIETHADQLLNAMLLNLTAFDFAQTVHDTVPPLQQLVTALAMANPRTVTDAVTTADGVTVTSATAHFAPFDQGRGISGGSIPAGTTIAAVVDAQTVTLSQAATAAATGVAVTIG